MLYVDGKKCVAVCMVHIDGKILMQHNPKSQKLHTSIAPVRREDLLTVLTGDVTTDKVLGKLSDSIDVERDIITSAFAYAAFKQIATQFDIEDLLLADEMKIQENECLVSSMLLDNNDYKENMIKCFSIRIEPSRALLDEIEQKHVLLDRAKIITKPSCESEAMEVFFMGMKLSQLSSIAVLLFWNLNFA